MVEKVITAGRNVVDFARYQIGSAANGKTSEISRSCRHCGAALSEGEREEECSSAFNIRTPPRKFYAD